MSAAPKVSVLIPTFNSARFLPEAIESVLAQDFTDCEILISDDASTDGSADVIRRYAARDARIRFQLQERNLGMVAHWNWCLGQARGEYVKFLFGDDKLASPAALRRQVGQLDAEPAAVLAVSARIIIDKDSVPVEIWDELGPAGQKRGTEMIARCIWRDRNLIGEPSAVMFRRAAGRRGFDPAWRQLVDQEMWFHLLAQGDLMYDPEPLCAFRLHGAQQTARNRDSHVSSAETLLLLARYLERVAAISRLRPDSLAIRRLLFRSIYYSRKNAQRDSIHSPAIAAAEQQLMDRLTPRWYRLCLGFHRATKPLVNLERWVGLKPRDQGRRPVPR